MMGFLSPLCQVFARLNNKLSYLAGQLSGTVLSLMLPFFQHHRAIAEHHTGFAIDVGDGDAPQNPFEV